MYQKVLNEYPDSRYNDESQFWLGYCLEKQEGSSHEAFEAFQELVNRSPDSPWADDALSRQIQLAEQFVRNGEEKYRQFLKDNLTHDHPKVRHESALALARLGDSISLPLLKEMREEEEYARVVEPLIYDLEEREEEAGATILVDENLKPERTSRAIAELKSAGKNLHYYSEKRFEQYHNMTRQSNDWWEEELLAFGMWHIVPTDSFETFISLPPGKQKEWYDIYWKKHDPTPTTLKNEARIEFERRVKYAREHFDYYDGLEGFFYAPWDARGEVYIKYGPPKSRKRDAYREFWYYPELNHVRFLIKPKVTNIFGRAIFLDERSVARSRIDGERMRNEYIFTPRFEFKLDKEVEPIKELAVEVKRLSPQNRTVLVRYRLPIDELTVRKADSGYRVEYVQSYVLYDSRMNEVLRRENMEALDDHSRSALTSRKHIQQAFQLDLTPGFYTIALQIEDRWSRKTAVKYIDFEVKG